MRLSLISLIKVGTKSRAGVDSFLLGALRFLVLFYQAVGGAIFGGACRFEPSCSKYALDAIRTHRPARALILILRRLVKCRPGGQWGFDPVPSLCCEHGLSGQVASKSSEALEFLETGFAEKLPKSCQKAE